MKKKKILSVTLATCLVMSTLAGCGSSGGDSGSSSGSSSSSSNSSSSSSDNAADSSGDTASAVSLDSLPAAVGEGTIVASPDFYAGVDLSDHYTVNMYLIGDTPNDWNRILDLTNEYLEPFNTDIAVTFMSWSDYQTMYSLVLAGGEQVDLIFTAPWCYMYTEAAKGSFYELTDDFIANCMPMANKYQDKDSWSETTLSGKTIAVPSNVAAAMGKIVAIRQDLADKYDISELKTWEDYMNFMITMGEKETPESGIYGLASSVDNNELWDVYRQQYDTFLALDSDYFDMIYSWDGDLPTVDEITMSYETDWFREYAKDMKTLADAGCWSRSALTNTVTDDDAFGALQGASIAWNGSVITYVRQAEQSEGVQCALYDLTTDHFVGCEAFSNNDMAIAAGSKNPERAGMILDLLKFDTYLNRLWILGIEGEHYTIDDEGYYTELDKSSDFAAYAISAAWAIKNDDLHEAGADPRMQAISDGWAERVENNPTITFVFDTTPVDSYVSAVKVVLDDYVPMLELGLVDDVDATLDEMIQKCYDSGLQTVKDEFAAQYEAWYATR
ncbi:MAG: ABC transporter substrate-binding protein [Lachnospiraceae bacterium]|nr:ABC transporter substrate-binding protein [Lachnospiraceae bacterium]